MCKCPSSIGQDASTIACRTPTYIISGIGINVATRWTMWTSSMLQDHLNKFVEQEWVMLEENLPKNYFALFANLDQELKFLNNRALAQNTLQFLNSLSHMIFSSTFSDLMWIYFYTANWVDDFF